MQRSEQIAQIAEAMAKAQGAVKGATKDALNPHFKSKYADLASCWDACREALSKNGIAVIQAPSLPAENTVAVETMLTHSSGEWFSETMMGVPSQPSLQGIGSAITYLRRYSLCAMVGIAPEDDDANSAVAGAPTAQRPAAPKVTPAQVEQMEKAHVAWVRKAKTEIGLCADQLALDEWWRKNKGAMDKLANLSQYDYDGVLAIFDERKEQVPAANIAGAAE